MGHVISGIVTILNPSKNSILEEGTDVKLLCNKLLSDTARPPFS